VPASACKPLKGWLTGAWSEGVWRGMARLSSGQVEVPTGLCHRCKHNQWHWVQGRTIAGPAQWYALTINCNFDVYEEVPDSDWHATVTDPMPTTSSGMTAVLLTRRWTSKSAWHPLDDGLEPQPIPVEDLADIRAAIHTIQAHGPQMVL
jgi:hypothetical protein